MLAVEGVAAATGGLPLDSAFHAGAAMVGHRRSPETDRASPLCTLLGRQSLQSKPLRPGAVSPPGALRGDAEVHGLWRHLRPVLFFHRAALLSHAESSARGAPVSRVVFGTCRPGGDLERSLATRFEPNMRQDALSFSGYTEALRAFMRLGQSSPGGGLADLSNFSRLYLDRP